MEEKTYLLEVNLISAQGLKPPSANLRRFQTYAVAWVDSAYKRRTRIDRVGGENPTWNDKFLFRVGSDFLNRETSAVSVEIHAAGYVKDPIVGSVRFLISNCLRASGGVSKYAVGAAICTPEFSAFQIRRPSGRFKGILNVGAMLIDGSDFAKLANAEAIGFQDLMGESRRQPHRHRRNFRKSTIKDDENSSRGGGGGGGDVESVSDADSTCSSTSTTSSTAQMDWTSKETVMAERRRGRSNGSGIFCGLGFQRRIHLSPLEENLDSHDDDGDERSRSILQSFKG